MPRQSRFRAEGITQELAGFCANLQWEDVPASVRHEAKRALLNYFAVALAGAADPTMDKLRRSLRGFNAGGDATIIGSGERADVLHAVWLNAMSANVHDFDDTHMPSILHPTAPVAPVPLALAQCRPMSGAELLLALVTGMEVACRVAMAVSPGHYRRGWHITSTCGVFGAAAAAARTMGLSPAQTVSAFGMAAMQAGGSVEALGTTAKSLGVGNAARNGLLSARLAADGLNGPDEPLEGERGFLRLMTDEVRTDCITQGLGQDWSLLSNTYKPYPCGVVLNPVIEACLGLRREHGLRVADVLAVTLTGHPLLRERTDRPAPATGRLSQVSAQHAVGVVLATGDAGLSAFSDAAAADSDVLGLGARVRFQDEPSMPVDAVRLCIQRSGGRSDLVCNIQAAYGGLERPLSDRDLEAKLETLSRQSGGTVNAAALAQSIWQLDAMADASLLLSGLRR